MADVTIVPNASQVQTVAATGGQSQSSPSSGPPAGTLVSGTIAGRDVNGNYVLKSPQGTFSLQSSTPLTYNSDVTIRVGANASGGTGARILTVNGEPFSQFSTPEPATTDSVSPSLLTQAAQPASEASSPTAATVRGIVVTAPPAEQANTLLSEGNAVVVRLAQTPGQAPAETAASTDSAATGTQSESAPEAPAASVSGSAAVAVQPQQVSQNPQPAAVVPATAPQSAPATTTNAPVAAAAAPVETELSTVQTVNQTPQTQTVQTESPPAQPQQTSGTPAGTNAAATSQTSQAATPSATPTTTPRAPVSALYNVYAKQSASAAAPAASPASVSTPVAPTDTNTSVPAQIVSTDENGTLGLQTPLGDVTVKTASLPGLFSAGAAVTIESPSASAAASAPATLAELAGSWESLKDIVSVVNSANPTAANALLARLPQIGPEFLSSSTAFITAFLQGDARKLLGDDTVDTLHNNGRQDLIDRFSGELSSLSGSFTAPQRPVSGWQTLFLPFVYQETLQQARIYVKRDTPKKERANTKTTADTRFVVEVDLSEIGPLQMDGLVRKKEQATAFDLVIRSQQPFSPEDQAEINGIYSGAAELTGFKGTLAFQVTRYFPVKPLEEAAAEEPHGITV